MVWRAWTDPDLLNRWYGPGAETIIHKFDLQPGGLWLNEMKYGGNSMFQKVIFRKLSSLPSWFGNIILQQIPIGTISPTR